MATVISMRQNFQLVNHRRNKYLHEPINIASEVWNYLVAYRRWMYKSFGKSVGKIDMQKHVGALRGDIQKGTGVAAFQHWQSLNLQALREICDRVDKAYTRFYDNLKKGMTVRKAGLPRFRKRWKHRSFVLPFSEKHHGRGNGNGCKIIDWGENGYGKIRLSLGERGKTKRVFKFHIGNRPLSECGTLKSVSIIRTGDGRFYLSFVTERELPRISYPSTGKIGGFDFGLTNFLTNDDGDSIASPAFLFDELDELRRRSKKLSGRGRKTLGSGSWVREKLNVARLHRKIANRRSDFHWKLAHQLCEEYDALCFEDLNLDGMKRIWGRKISDLALSDFLRALEWVARKTGREVRYVDRFYPSSKTCSQCGAVKEEMPLRQRVFECGDCGLVIGRDHNAAINIRNQSGRDSVLGKSRVSDSKTSS